MDEISLLDMITIKQAIQTLSNEERVILRLILAGYTYKDTATILREKYQKNFTPKRVQTIYQRIIRYLQEKIREDE